MRPCGALPCPVDSSTRQNGRAANAYAKTAVTTSSTGPATGSAMAKLGRTAVLSGGTARHIADEAGALHVTAICAARASG